MSALPPYLTDALIDESIAIWLREDIGTGDVTTESTISPTANANGMFIAKAAGVLSGTYAVDRVFRHVDSDVQVKWHIADGGAINKGDKIATIDGPARAVLIGERLALNLLQRMSGIATATRAMVAACGDSSSRILDTRKTVPGLRLLDKWAVLHGGGVNHRIGLFDMIMIKDNHIAAAGGITNAVHAADAYRQKSGRSDLLIELETRTLEEVRTGVALPAVDRLLLDNMVKIDQAGRVDTTMLEDALGIVAGRKSTEASGNVTLDTVPAIAATNVDFISSGALTHSVVAMDISLILEVEVE